MPRRLIFIGWFRQKKKKKKNDFAKSSLLRRLAIPRTGQNTNKAGNERPQGHATSIQHQNHHPKTVNSQNNNSGPKSSSLEQDSGNFILHRILIIQWYCGSLSTWTEGNCPRSSIGRAPDYCCRSRGFEAKLGQALFLQCLLYWCQKYFKTGVRRTWTFAIAG